MASIRTLESSAQPVFAAFIRFLQSHGVTVTVTSARRDMDQQRKLYEAYKAGRSRYPAAPPGKSTHGMGIAVDLHLEPPLYEAAGRAWERAGFTWGGRFSDEVHFDLRPHRG